MTITTHRLHLADRAIMLAMRGVLAVSRKPASSPEARPKFDTMVAKVAAADGVAYQTAQVGGVPGWWCRPADAIPGAAILYLHGGAYLLGSAWAYRNFASQVATRAGVAVFVVDYGLAPERPFPAAFEDALAAYQGLGDAGYDAIALAGDSAGGGRPWRSWPRWRSGRGASRRSRVPARWCCRHGPTWRCRARR